MPIDQTISWGPSIYPSFVRGACSLMCVVCLLVDVGLARLAPHGAHFVWLQPIYDGLGEGATGWGFDIMASFVRNERWLV